ASAVNNLGQPIAGITTDVDDEPGLRATKPDLGADEFAAYNLVVNTVGSGQTGISPVLPNYPTGTSVTLTAAPLAHYHFVGWSGDLGGNTNPVTFSMTSDRNITATFAIDSFTVAVISNGNGTAQKSPNLSQHPYGSFVDLTGIPANGYHFTNWSGDTITTQNPYTVYVDHARSVAANFAINTYTVTSAFTGSGSIARIPDQLT